MHLFDSNALVPRVSFTVRETPTSVRSTDSVGDDGSLFADDSTSVPVGWVCSDMYIFDTRCSARRCDHVVGEFVESSVDGTAGELPASIGTTAFELAHDPIFVPC